MKHSDEAIEKVLAGLRDVEIPAGMERRILDGLEERAARRAEAGRRWYRPVWRGVPAAYVACGVAVVGLAVVMLMVPAVRRFGHGGVQSQMGVAPVKPIPAMRSTIASRDTETVLHASDVRFAKRVDAAESGLGRAGDSAGGSEDDVALSETRAASFPAPPMPLTDQEKLLLRLAHKNDPVELAMLDPKLRELQDAEDQAEFQSFFSVPVVKQPAPEEQAQPEPTATEQAAHGESTAEKPASKQAAPAGDQAVPAPQPDEDSELKQSRAKQVKAKTITTGL
ncbi:MAG: hypothetical protein ABSA39_07605 [Edaphobacter sp.]